MHSLRGFEPTGSLGNGGTGPPAAQPLRAPPSADYGAPIPPFILRPSPKPQTCERPVTTAPGASTHRARMATVPRPAAALRGFAMLCPARYPRSRCLQRTMRAYDSMGRKNVIVGRSLFVRCGQAFVGGR